MGFFDLFKKKRVESEQSAGTTPEDIAREQERVEAEEAQHAEEERKELEAGLEKTKEGFFSKLRRAVAGRSTVDSTTSRRCLLPRTWVSILR